jgi:hypothetical protein
MATSSAERLEGLLLTVIDSGAYMYPPEQFVTRVIDTAWQAGLAARNFVIWDP